MIVTLWASIATLAALTIVNLLLCLAVIRRLRAAEATSAWSPSSADMPAPGTAVSALTATTTDGVLIGPDDLAHDEVFVGVLSIGCPSCETFAGEVQRGSRSLPERALLFVTASAGQDPGPMVERLRRLAPVIVAADDGPELSAFGAITAFPTFIRIEWGVVVASDVRADAVLRTFRRPRKGVEL